MATISNTPRPGYVWDSTDNVWYPIGVGGHSHPDYITQATAVNPTIIDAKGDIITATAADTPARLAVGNNGETLVADSSASTGLRWQGSQAAGKNYIINGGMDIWQRGTSFTTTGAYSADRWYLNIDGASAGTASQITSSLPTGFRYGMKLQRTAGNTGTGGIGIGQSFETSTSIPLAGQTVSFTFWAKAGANFSGANLQIRIGFGTGTDQAMVNAYGGWTGYSEVSGSVNLTTSWVRYTTNGTVPSNATQISVRTFYSPTGTAGADDSYSITGHQFELGSVPTTFTRAGGTIQGELAACQRYYQIAGDTIYEIMDGGYMASGNVTYKSWIYAVPMRTTPTGTVVGSWVVSGIGQPTLQATQQRGFTLRATSSTTGAYYFHSNTTYYLTFSAEL